MASNAQPQPIRPLVPTGIRTEFGDVLEDDAFYTTQVGRDMTYVPGYSDIRRERDLAIKEAQARNIPWSEVPTLPVRLHWVRSARNSGAPDSTKQVQFGNDGYKTVNAKDVGQPWLTELPAGASVLADGSIIKGDTILMVADSKNAARNSYNQRKATEQMSKHAAPAELMRLGASKPGSDPTFESTPGPAIAVPRSAIKA